MDLNYPPINEGRFCSANGRFSWNSELWTKSLQVGIVKFTCEENTRTKIGLITETIVLGILTLVFCCEDILNLLTYFRQKHFYFSFSPKRKNIFLWDLAASQSWPDYNLPVFTGLLVVYFDQHLGAGPRRQVKINEKWSKTPKIT